MEPNRIIEKMDLERTDKLFDSLISRSKVHSEKPLGKQETTNARVVIASGNLHVSTARAKLTAIKLAGHLDESRQIKSAVERRVRDAYKPTE